MIERLQSRRIMTHGVFMLGIRPGSPHKARLPLSSYTPRPLSPLVDGGPEGAAPALLCRQGAGSLSFYIYLFLYSVIGNRVSWVEFVLGFLFYGSV